MKFSLVVPFLAVGALAATPVRKDPTVVKRDLTTITSVVADIGTKVGALDSAVKSFSGDPAAIVSGSSDLLSTISSGNEKIAATSAISLTDALTLQSVIGDLTTAINTTVNDFIAKKSDLVAAGLGDAIHQSFVDQKAASDTLAKTITSKVPESIQELAAQLSAGIATAIQRGIDAFAGTGGGTGSSSSAAPTSAGPTSGTPAPTSAQTTGAPTSTPGGYSTPVTSASHTASPSGSGSGYNTPTPSPTQFTGAAAAPTGHFGVGVAMAAVAVAAAAL